MQIKKVYSLVTTDIQNAVFDHTVFVEVQAERKKDKFCSKPQ